MTRSNVLGTSTFRAARPATALGALIMVVAFASLVLVGCPAGGVGDPCVPEDEFKGNFAGFKLTEENIESRSFQCETRICLVNHFQGRVSCPQGQAEPTPCTDDGQCSGGDTCRAAGQIIPDCDPTPCGDAGADPNNCNAGDNTNQACGGRICNPSGRFCECQSGDCPEGFTCDAGATNVCTTRVCASANDPARCYIPGTNDPVSVPVCSQCSAQSKRDAENSVYCSCRCGVAEGDPEDENFNFCECPAGFVCEEVRENVGLGDKQLTGKFCIREGTKFVDETNCGTVQGYWDAQCAGTRPAGG
jgi:hypothetical protein